MQSNTHESLNREHVPQGSSDRSFGLVFTVFFAFVAFWPLVHRRSPRIWAVCVSAAFLLLALAGPRFLHPLNLAWARIGRLLGKITNPIVTGLMFYLIFTPTAVLFKLTGMDPLRLKFDVAAASYWIIRDPAGPAPESMSHQF